MSVHRPSFYPFQRSNVLHKDILVPSPPGLHSSPSEASFPRISCSCRVPDFTAVVHSDNLPPRARRALLADTQILELVSPAVNNLVAPSCAPAMVPP